MAVVDELCAVACEEIHPYGDSLYPLGARSARKTHLKALKHHFGQGDYLRYVYPVMEIVAIDKSGFEPLFESMVASITHSFPETAALYDAVLANLANNSGFVNASVKTIALFTDNAFLQDAFDQRKFVKAHFKQVDFGGSVLSGADFCFANFEDCVFEKCVVVDANFGHAIFSNSVNISQIDISKATSWTIQSLMMALERSAKLGCKVDGKLQVPNDFAYVDDYVSTSLQVNKQQIVNGCNRSLVELNDELNKVRFHFTRISKGQTQQREMLSTRILALEQQVAMHHNLVSRYLVWQAEHEHFYGHDNVKIQLYYRKFVSQLCSILNAIFISQSELIELNHRQVGRADRKVKPPKPAGFAALGQNAPAFAKILTETVHILHASRESFHAIGTFIASLGKGAAKFSHSLPFIGGLFGLANEWAEKAVKAAAENAMEHAADQLVGMTPLMLERLSVEIAIRMTKKYTEHVKLLKANHGGVVRFAECGAMRVFVCILGNKHINQYDQNGDLINQLLDFVQDAPVKQKKIFWNKRKFIRVDFDTVFSPKHQALEVDPSTGVTEVLTEDYLHRTASSVLPKPTTSVAEGAAPQAEVEGYEQTYVDQLEAKSVADDRTIVEQIREINELRNQISQLHTSVGNHSGLIVRNQQNHAILARSISEFMNTVQESIAPASPSPVKPIANMGHTK